ncbi:MAG TPA: hypothetical protein VFV58_03585 [Blastocatellia bacterium]|jgi:hypothetical protein|nr:hypothetical protein [Blastocatellia bacterium]
MCARSVFPGLKSYTKRSGDVSRYFVHGKGELRLGRSDFKAQGGEGAVYVKGSTAYKIYANPTRAIPLAKIDELSALDQPNIIRPLDLILDGKNTPVGYSMRSVEKAHALCQLFPKAFRQRNNLTPELMLRLVLRLQAGVSHVHDKRILIVDLNELNFLVSADFSEVFFVDVDSYQTPSFPATVLMESVRDRHTMTFNHGSDWFSFAVVSFQMFTGIHPFKGAYAPLQHLPDKAKRLDARMLANISVLHPNVSVPSSCLPFSVIPQVYLDWYRAVFEQGDRLPPPDNAHALVIVTTARANESVESGSFVINRVHEFDTEIIWHDGVITVTQSSVYFDGKIYPKPPFDVKLVVSPRQRHLIAAFHDGTRLRFRDLTVDKDVASEVEGEGAMLSSGKLYIKQHESIFAVDLIELPQSLLLGLRLVANVMIRSTRMFEGVAIQNLLGANYVSIPTADGVCHQIRIPELDDYQVVDARRDRNVLIVVVTTEGRYDKLIFRFSDDFSGYDCRRLDDIVSTGIEFTVLDSGIVLHLAEDGRLEVFPNVRDSAKIRVIRDQALDEDLRLFHRGTQALIAGGPSLYKIRLKS